jgi:hypothetical protein
MLHPVAVEKLDLSKLVEKTLHWESLQTPFLIFLGIFYPPIFCCFEKNRVFQQPRLSSTIEIAPTDAAQYDACHDSPSHCSLAILNEGMAFHSIGYPPFCVLSQKGWADLGLYSCIVSWSALLTDEVFRTRRYRWEFHCRSDRRNPPSLCTGRSRRSCHCCRRSRHVTPKCDCTNTIHHSCL